MHGKDAVARLTAGIARGIEMVDVSDMERIAEMGSVHLRLLAVDIVGECNVPSLALEGVTHQADAGEELGDGALREKARSSYRLIRSKGPADTVGIAIDVGLPKARDLPTTFEQCCGIRHIASHVSTDLCVASNRAICSERIALQGRHACVFATAGHARNRHRQTQRGGATRRRKSGFPGSFGVMRTKTKARLAQSAAEEFLRRCAARFYTRHQGRDPLRSRRRLQSVLQVDGLVIAIEFERRRTLFFRTEARILSAAEGELILDTGARQIDCQQAGFHLVDEVERSREIAGLDGGRESERNIVGDLERVVQILCRHRREHRTEYLFRASVIFGSTSAKIVGSQKYPLS